MSTTSGHGGAGGKSSTSTAHGGAGGETTTFTTSTGGMGGATTGTGGATTSTGGMGGTGGTGECAAGDTKECYSGDPATKGVGSCKAGTQTCEGGKWGPCNGEVTPAPETCNGSDDDCNGTADDGLAPVTCGVGACQVTVNPCLDGQPVDCVPLPPAPAELCNGIDDNCDGQVDEGCSCIDGKTQPCYTGPMGTQHVGACADGTQTCANGAWGPCTGDVVPTAEKCDGKDNDCDGVVDNGNPEGGAICNTGKPGACAAGTAKCTNGALFCTQNVQPSAEICDGIDNDCDGTVDNGNPGSGMPCSTGMTGNCGAGSTQCSGGTIVCKPVNVGPEVCDGLDNNCNGQIDEGNPGGGLACNTGKFGVCSAGTATCTNGMVLCTPLVQPSAEVCDGKDNDCDGIVDNGNPGGGIACSTGKNGVCAAGTTACASGSIVCNQNAQPSAEICDGLDNNCDGQIDEGNPGGGAACNTGKPGLCGTGMVQCQNGALGCAQTVQPVAEICDGLDNDCDGQVDNGNPGGGQSCNTGKPGVCSVGTTFCGAGSIKCVQNVQPGPEVCDGLDNNCDGQVDEGNPGGGAPCNTGKLGVCAAGTMKCVNGSLQCVQNVQPSAEICDGKDNNCDGTIDEGTPGGGVSCNTGKLGVCAAGVTACTNGVLTCNQLVQPGPEVCDGLDNNCDGQVDNGNPGGGVACNTGKPGVCAAGTTACSNGTIVCNQLVQPSAEICDGKDNNCDGQVDEGNPGVGTACNTGKLGVCAAGTVSACINGIAVCTQNVQPSAEICDGLDNNCDGLVDNGNPGGGASCTTGKLGVCAAGTVTCTGGALACVQNVQPSTEICDGKDNNCNGQIDEGGACCAHSRCVTGTTLSSSCDSCVANICAADPYCCTTSWDSICVGEVASVCGLACP